MAKVGWKFKDGKNYLYDKKIFEQTVRSLIYRVKPRGVRVLNLDFTNESESVYVVLVADSSNDYYMFRISSHPSYSTYSYQTYDTKHFNGFLALEGQIKRDLEIAYKAEKDKLKFNFEYQDFFFFSSMAYLFKEQHLQFIIQTRLFKEKNLNDKTGVLISNSDLEIMSTVTDQKYLEMMEVMIAKGYLNIQKINDKYSIVTTTHFFRSLGKYYSPLYENETKKINFKSYFDQIIESFKTPKNLNSLWTFKNGYYFDDFYGDLKQAIQAFMSTQMELFEISYNHGEKSVAVTFISHVNQGHFLKVHICEQRQSNLDYFYTTLFKNMHTLVNAIQTYLQEGTFNRVTYEDYLLLKLLLNFEKHNKQLLVSLQKFDIDNILFVEAIGSSPMIQSVKRALSLGLVTKAEVNEHYSKLVLTPLGNRLFQQTSDMYLPQFLSERKQKTLPNYYLKAYTATLSECFIEQKSIFSRKPRLIPIDNSEDPLWKKLVGKVSSS